MQCSNWLLLAVLVDKADPRRSHLCPLVDPLNELLLTAGLETHVSSGCVYSLLEQNLPQSAVSENVWRRQSHTLTNSALEVPSPVKSVGAEYISSFSRSE